jgi:hypothetical protein
MGQIFTYILQAVLAAFVIRLLRLNTKRVVISHDKPVSWVWKALALVGKFLFWFGLFVFFANLAVDGAEAQKTAIGASMWTLGLVFWLWGGLVIYFKRN